MRVFMSVKGHNSADASAREAPPTIAASDADRVGEGPSLVAPPLLGTPLPGPSLGTASMGTASLFIPGNADVDANAA